MGTLGTGAAPSATTAWRITSPRIQRFGPCRVLIHHLSQQVLIEASPVDADADRFLVPAGHFNHFRELRVALAAAADVAGMMRYLASAVGTAGILAQQLMSIEMEVADQRNADAQLIQAFADGRHRGRGLRRVHCQAHQFGAGAGQGPDLFNGAGDIGRVRIGHGLDHDGIGAADADSPNGGYERFATWMRHWCIVPLNMTAK